MFLKALELISDLLIQLEVVGDAGMEGMGEMLSPLGTMRKPARRKVHEEQHT